MTRINTNVSSLIAQNNLSRVNGDLQNRLTRLSTGLRINSGKDDPAGLIASEALRSNIIATEKAITNSERANQLIATADSALGQVSQLLNDIRGLVSEAANTGALSDEQIAANQLQVDSSLEAIDRIAQITSFQGKKLLDGSLNFTTTGVDNSKITSLQIDQANFGTQSSIGVEINIVAQATRGTLNYAFGAIAQDISLQVAGGNGAEAFNFAANSTIEEIASAINLVSDATGVEAVVEQAATKGSVTVSSFGGNNEIVLTANEAGFDAGNVRIKYTKGGTGSTTATFTGAVGSDPATLNVALKTSAYEAASLVIDQAGNDNAFTITADVAGAAYNGIAVVFTNGGVAGAETAVFDGATLTIDKAATSTAAQIVAAVNNAATNPEVARLFTAALNETTGGGAGAVAAAGAQGVLAGGVDGGAIVATANDVVSAINAAVGNNKVTAALAEGADGHLTVTEFSDFAFYGSAAANNRLQFLAPGGSPNIRFVANAGASELSLDVNTDPRVETRSSLTVQNTAANGTFTISARFAGSEYDGYTVSVLDDANVTAGVDEYAVLDKANKTLKIYIDDTNSTAQNIIDVINNDSLVSDFFEAENFGTSTGAAAVTIANLTLGATAGGVSDPGTLIINLETDENGVIQTTANDLIAFFDDPSDFISDSGEAAAALAELTARGISVTNAEGSNGTGKLAATTSDLTFATSGSEFDDAQASGTTFAVNGLNARLKVTAINGGAAYDNVRIEFIDDATVTAGNEVAEYDDVNKILTVRIDAGSTTANQVISAIDTDLGDLFDAEVATGGSGASAVTVDDFAVLTGGVVDNGSTQGAALLGNSDLANLGLTFRATRFGSEGFVEVKALSGSFSLTDAEGEDAERSAGQDVNARINGIQAVGKGLQASINTSSLDLTFSLSDSVADGEKLTVQITGGGAVFQLGPNVVSNQQARLGIQSVNTSQLGGVSGRLYELRSGGSKSLTADVGGAALVVDEVISNVTSLRGRLGAFQKTTLETNIFTLNDTLANLTEAESSIRDADFAAESAKLTRAQILTQSTTSVLAIANSNPQNVLALLRG